MAANHASEPRDSLPAALERTTVRQSMQLGLFECRPDASVSEIACALAERRIHCVVVPGLDGSGSSHGWGVVSDMDLVRTLHAGASELRAGEMAESPPVAVHPGDSLAHAAALMSEHGVAHLVVLSPDTGRPVGMLSTFDLAQFARRFVATSA